MEKNKCHFRTGECPYAVRDCLYCDPDSEFEPTVEDVDPAERLFDCKFEELI